MASLVEMAKEMVVARANTTPVSADEMLTDLKRFYNELKKLELGETEIEPGKTEEASPAEPTLTVKEAFKKNEIKCMICGKGGFKTLTRHLTTAHQIKPREYKKQFGIPAKQSLSAKSYSESRKQMAIDRGLAGNLAKAREVRKANLEAKQAVTAKAKVKTPAKQKTLKTKSAVK